MLAITLLVAALFIWRWSFHRSQVADMRETLAALELPEDWEHVQLQVTSEYGWHPLCVDTACPSMAKIYTATVDSASAVDELATQVRLLDGGPVTITDRYCRHLIPCAVIMDAGSWDLSLYVQTQYQSESGPQVPPIEGVIEATIQINATDKRE